jgi:hypothetical protein
MFFYGNDGRGARGRAHVRGLRLEPPRLPCKPGRAATGALRLPEARGCLAAGRRQAAREHEPDASEPAGTASLTLRSVSAKNGEPPGLSG